MPKHTGGDPFDVYRFHNEWAELIPMRPPVERTEADGVCVGCGALTDHGASLCPSCSRGEDDRLERRRR